MVKARTEKHIAAPGFRHGKINDGVKRDIQRVIGRTGSLGEFLSGVAQRQVGIEEISAQAKIFVGIARYPQGGIKTSAADPGLSRAAVKIRSRAHIEVPILIILRLGPSAQRYIFRRLLAGIRLLRGRLCSGLWCCGLWCCCIRSRRLCCRGRLRECSRSQTYCQYQKRQRRRELSYHSFSSKTGRGGPQRSARRATGALAKGSAIDSSQQDRLQWDRIILPTFDAGWAWHAARRLRPLPLN